MARKVSDLVVVVAITAATLTLTLLGVDNRALQVALALPLVLVFPGYAITAAAFPTDTLGGPERILFSFGLSLAVAGLGGLVLNWTPWGLQASLWVILLFSIIVGASVIALVRRRRRSVDDTSQTGGGLTFSQVLMLGAAAIVFLVAIGISLIPAPQQGLQGYALLWIVPTDTTEQHTARLGVSSKEFAATKYRLQLEVNGQVLQEWSSIVLEPGQTWEVDIVLPAESLGDKPVEATLYRLDSPAEVYRHVIWWPTRS